MSAAPGFRSLCPIFSNVRRISQTEMSYEKQVEDCYDLDFWRTIWTEAAHGNYIPSVRRASS